VEYYKDFDGWNNYKKKISCGEASVFFREREVWWCAFGINVGVEMDGKNLFYERPILILRKINRTSAWILPLSSRLKKSTYFYHLASLSSYVSLSQIKMIDTRRLLRKDSSISLQEYLEIIEKIKNILLHNETSPAHTR